MKRLCTVGCILMLTCAMAGAAIITQETWTTVNNNYGWTGLDSPSHAGAPYATLTNTTGYLAIQTVGIPIIEEDFIFDVGSLGASWSNYTATPVVRAIQFNFMMSNAVPDLVALYFTRTGGNGIWSYEFTPSMGWQTYGINLDWNLNYDGQWYSDTVGANRPLFDADLAQVDEIGIILLYNGAVSDQIYGLDNFQLLDEPVPEPETYAVLGFALLSLGITFRRQMGKHFSFARIAGRS